MYKYVSIVNLEDCLKAHNAKRALHQNTQPLQRDARLDQDAKKWADHLAKTGSFDHDPNLRDQGENLYKAWGSGTAAGSCSDAVNSW